MASTYSEKHQEALERDGYFIMRGIIDRQSVDEIKGEIESLLVASLDDGEDADNERADGKSIPGIDMFRKLGYVDRKSPAVWNHLVLNETVLDLNRRFLENDIQSRGLVGSWGYRR